MQSLRGVFQRIPVARRSDRIHVVALFKGSLLRGRPMKYVRFLARGFQLFAPAESFWDDSAFHMIPVVRPYAGIPVSQCFKPEA
eukprot:9481857-Pyramimonas_sp.AAC.1